MRTIFEKELKLIFEKVEMFCKNYSMDMSLPHRVCKQVHWDNIPVTTLEDYYCVTIFIPYLENFLKMISDRE
jgi:hypothetical protein